MVKQEEEEEVMVNSTAADRCATIMARMFLKMFTNSSHPLFWLRILIFEGVFLILLGFTVVQAAGDTAPLVFLSLSMAFGIFWFPLVINQLRLSSYAYAKMLQDFRKADSNNDGVLSPEEADSLVNVSFPDSAGANGFKFSELKPILPSHEQRFYVTLSFSKILADLFGFCGSLLVFKIGDPPADSVAYFSAIWAAIQLTGSLANYVEELSKKFRLSKLQSKLSNCCAWTWASLIFFISVASFVIVAKINEAQTTNKDENDNDTITQDEINFDRIPAYTLSGILLGYALIYIIAARSVFACLSCCLCIRANKSRMQIKIEALETTSFTKQLFNFGQHFRN